MEASERDIQYQTEDGYTIYGSLHLPAGADADHPVPAALLLHGPGHDRGALTSFFLAGISQILTGHGIAALRIDWRGRGESIGDLEYHSFTADQKAKIPLDVKAGLSYLAALPEIDGDRLGLFGEEIGAEWAILGAQGDPRVKAFSLVSGRLSERSLAELRERSQLPVQCLVSQEDKRGFADMSAAYGASKHPASDLVLYQDLGVGITMFTVWKYRYPDEKAIGFLRKQGVDTDKIGMVVRDPGDEKPLESEVSDWIAARLKSIGRVREVKFTTEDDFTIYGNLRIPEHLEEGAKAPGIVLLHSGLSDRWVFHRLERICAELGMAVLNIDWRGRGKSREQGTYATLARDVADRAHLDAKAALDVLADQPEVDSRNLALLGTYLGAKYGVQASLGDSRVGALVMLSGYIPNGKERDQVAGLPYPILFITSRGLGPVTGAMIDLHELTRDRGSEIIIYEGGALGYKLFDFDDTLEPRIATWVSDRLAARKLA